jgi:hypothetical protein
VKRTRGFLPGGTGPASSKQGTCSLIEPGFDKKLGKGRMRHVRTPIVQTDLGIARQFEVALAFAMVRDGEHSHFCVHIRGDTDFPMDFDVPGMTEEFGPVSKKGVLVHT